MNLSEPYRTRLVLAKAALDLVSEIATNSPLIVTGSEGHINVCKFCEIRWAESSFKDWQEHHPRYLELWAMSASERYEAYKRSGFGKPDYWLAVGEHHEEDCLWIRANKIIRGNN